MFRLRVVDELKDAAIDRRGRPDRPLPAGLVTAAELRRLAVAVVIAEVGLAVLLGGRVLLAFGGALLWSALAAADFFQPARLAARPLVNVLLHSPTIPLLAACAWWATPAAAFGPALAGWLLLAWSAGLALEVGRKTRAPDEERAAIETYSRALGPARATLLAAGLLALAALGATVFTAAAGVAPVIPLMLAIGSLLGGLLIVWRRRFQFVRTLVPPVVLLLLLWPVAAGLPRGWGTP
jgi:4-hydroxybenzoate polyprenyltransferase